MHIKALNTIEIRVADEADVCIESRLRDYIARLEITPGCLSYALSRSAADPGLWILSGYWKSREQMTEHFLGEPMAGLVATLVDLCAQLNFATFAPVVAELQPDGA